jgi:hypothetical protein
MFFRRSLVSCSNPELPNNSVLPSNPVWLSDRQNR